MIFTGERVDPLSFLLFINHLPTYVDFKCKLFFADDRIIYLKIRQSNIVDMSSNLSSCLDIYATFHVASAWGLQINAE